MKVIVFLSLICISVGQETLRQPYSAEPISVQRTKDCPAGFDLIGKQCVATETLPFKHVCPPGTVELHGECASFTRATRVCHDEGSVLNSNGQCSKTVLVSAEYECDQGESEGHQCRITSDVPPVCPAGFQRRHDECVRFTPRQKTCPEGFNMEGKECAQRETFPALAVCPAGFFQEDKNQCVKTVPQSPRCPSGHSLTGLECVKEVSKILAPCPDGFTSAETDCKRSVEFPTRPICPEGFQLDNNQQCVQSSPVPPTCPSGTTRDSVNQCVREVAKLVVCDDGETLIDGNCKRVSHFASELQCSPGFSLIHGKCKKADRQAPVLRCDTGILKNDVCVIETSGSPLLACPEGFLLAKGPKCVRDVSYDCSRTLTKTECEMPAFAQANRRQLHVDYKTKVVPVPHKVEASVAVESKTPICSQVPHVIPQTCTKVEEASVQYVCADGSAPVGKSCVTLTTTSPQQYCTVGQFDKSNGDCVQITIEPAQRICHIGQLNGNNSCEQVDVKPAALICPDGSIPVGKDGRCTVVEQEIVHPDRIIRRPARYICDLGVRKGEICVETETVPRAPVCPSDTIEQNDQCVKAVPAVHPEPITVRQPASFVCHDGSQAIGDSCSSRSTLPVQYVCREGVTEGTRCVHSVDLVYPPAKISRVPARPVCPTGYLLQGKQCKSVQSEAAELQCPEGYTRFEDDGARECVRATAHVTTCPSGTQPSQNGCIKKSYVAPRVTEIKVCTKGQPGC